MANYKVVFNPNMGGQQFEKECPTLDIAKAVFDAVADYTLFLHDNGLMPDYSNWGQILIEDDDGDWIGYEEDDE